MTTPNQPLQEESNFGDSSGQLFSIYYKAAEDEDNKMVERWQKDADGILFFTGLFSAAVAALLAVTVQDLKPNSQDTSSFYLGNIYQVLADPNATRPSISSPVAKPPSFSPSRYAVWVNSLWFLSLVMSLSCALWATSLQQWARRYLRLAQPARCSPEKRARMRAFFADGVEKMHIPLAVEGLPTLLHLSLFLFFGGLIIFLFNVDREVFRYVVWWIGLFSLVYGMITLLPLFRQHSPYNSPLSTPVWFLYATMTYVTVKILSFIVTFCFCFCFCFCGYRIRCIDTWMLTYIADSGKYYRRRMLGGMEKAAEETLSGRLSKIDVCILDWTITTLGDDDSLKNFFEAIPGFFNSKLVKHLENDFHNELLQKFRDALDGFLGRTWSSNSVNDSEKLRRLDISMNAVSLIPHSGALLILCDNLFKHRDEVPQTAAMGQTLARWLTSSNQSVTRKAQVIIASILVGVRKRNDSWVTWVTLAARVFDLPEGDFRDNVAHGVDSLLLAILIHVTRQSLRADRVYYPVLETLSKLDIRNTLPRQQHEFCTLWNEIVRQLSRNQRFHANHINPVHINPVLVNILRGIRHPYITLHQGTDAAPTAFSASTHEGDLILYMPSSYPLCNLASHRPEVPLSIPSGNSPDNDVMEPPSSSNPTTTSQRPDMTPPTNPVHSSSRPTGASPTPAVADAPQEIPSAATLTHPLEGNKEQDSDMVAPGAGPGTSQTLSTASTNAPTPALIPIPTSPQPNTSSESYDVGVISDPNSSHFVPPFVGSSISASCLTSSTALPRLRARGLVNSRNICFANAVFHLLVNSPPFWNLFRELEGLKGQRGAGVPQTGGGATPLVDATLRLFKEFIIEETPPTQQQSQPVTGGTSRADEEKKEGNVVDSFEPAYVYEAMKEKRQLKALLDGQQQDAEEFLCLYLDALDEEILVLLASISGRQSASAALEVEERAVSQSGQTDSEANPVESPTTRIFGVKFRSLVRAPNQLDLVPTEDWRSLHLDIQPDSIRTVQDAIARISHSSSVQISASGLSDASQQVLIEALPPVLVLHLNRVRYDASAGGITKIGKSIQISPELEIPLDIMVPNARRPSEPPRYKLHGVLYHHGESASGGHYSIDVLHPNGDGGSGGVWLRIDDEAVSVAQREDVFGGNDTATEQADERSAYLLFYCHTAPTRLR